MANHLLFEFAASATARATPNIEGITIMGIYIPGSDDPGGAWADGTLTWKLKLSNHPKKADGTPIAFPSVIDESAAVLGTTGTI